MNIMLITDIFNAGGREKVIADLANNLSNAGNAVSILILDGSNSDYIEHINPTVRCIKFNVFKNGRFSLNPIVYTKLGAFLKKNKPDIIHYHLYAYRLLLCSLIAKLFFISSPQIRTVHTSGLFYEETQSKLNKLRLISEKIAVKISKMTVIGISKKIHENNDIFFKSSARKLVHIYNGLDVSSYFHIENDAKSCKVTYIYLARLVNGKNHDFLIRLWPSFIKGHPNSELHIVGDGNLRFELEELTKNLGVESSIIFLGNLSDVTRTLAVANIALFPSSYEGFSISLLEYFASNLPVIAHDIPAFSEIATHEKNIYLIPLFDAGSFFNAMSRLYYEPKEREYIGKNARLLAERFSIDEFIESHISLYDDLLQREGK